MSHQLWGEGGGEEGEEEGDVEGEGVICEKKQVSGERNGIRNKKKRRRRRRQGKAKGPS